MGWASRTVNWAFAAIAASTAGIVYYVHYSQDSERRRMHMGVVRDEERRLRKLRELEQGGEQPR